MLAFSKELLALALGCFDDAALVLGRARAGNREAGVRGRAGGEQRLELGDRQRHVSPCGRRGTWGWFAVDSFPCPSGSRDDGKLGGSCACTRVAMGVPLPT